MEIKNYHLEKTLWTKNYTLLIIATIMGAAGGIAGDFALSFLVYDETGSTLASAFLLCIQIVPNFLIPLTLSPAMDRLPRKPFLVGGDIINGILYTTAGIYLLHSPFSYIGYLFFSLLLSSLSSFDSLAFNTIFPQLISDGFAEKGYTVSTMIYPVMKVLMMPVAALLMKVVGVAWILIFQGVLSILAAFTENFIHITETVRPNSHFSFSEWKKDIFDTITFLKSEKGLSAIYLYMAITNGISSSFSTILIAFFRTAAGFTTVMYSFFSAAEFIGRSLGGLLHYHITIPAKKKFSIAFFIYQFYEFMDMILLWIPYPAMLVNRGICGFLGINSAVMRSAAVQKYIPNEYRARLSAYETALVALATAVFSLLIGTLGEILDYKVCLTICGAAASLALWSTIWKERKSIRKIYEKADAVK